MYVSTEDGSPLTVIGFPLKGAIITFFFSFTGEEGAAGDRRVGREEIASGPDNSDRRGYVGGGEGETESVLAAFFSSNIVSSNFLLVPYKEVTLSFPLLEASRDQSK